VLIFWQDGYFAYSYRLRPGVNWDSHGLKVAQLAGLPDPVIKVASDTLDWLKQNRRNQAQCSDIAPADYHNTSLQMPSQIKATLAL
jgi:DNA mismatch repair ATPase MutS